ncbi:hypothetical protein GCM10017566_20090 [Amycolatopsis bartoniae]|uniref:Uncharacterized protein n=1 Tax=Amycolatopsis bartoniae TaxID=941986 RepID=A0A8H9IQ76_9PSEU|nr:hypothetical protein GCM10017566_20090 [Amycolatopsis bartoniae]
MNLPRVQAVLQGITTYSPRAFEDFAPPDPTCFGCYLTAFVGTEDSGPADAFDFLVCTPLWLGQCFAEGGGPSGASPGPGYAWSSDGRVLFGSGLLLVERWSAQAIHAAVDEQCQATAGPDWGAVASRLGRVLVWEYGYRYDAHVDAHPGPSFPPERV